MAGAKLSWGACTPIVIGVQIDGRLPTKLNRLTVRPSSRTGTSVNTSDQAIFFLAVAEERHGQKEDHPGRRIGDIDCHSSILGGGIGVGVLVIVIFIFNTKK